MLVLKAAPRQSIQSGSRGAEDDHLQPVAFYGKLLDWSLVSVICLARTAQRRRATCCKLHLAPCCKLSGGTTEVDPCCAFLQLSAQPGWKLQNTRYWRRSFQAVTAVSGLHLLPLWPQGIKENLLKCCDCYLGSFGYKLSSAAKCCAGQALCAVSVWVLEAQLPLI